MHYELNLQTAHHPTHRDVDRQSPLIAPSPTPDQILDNQQRLDGLTAESQALELAQDAAVDLYGLNHRFTANDICRLHRLWLGPIYPWAGEYRSVNKYRQGRLSVRACAANCQPDGGVGARCATPVYTLSYSGTP